MEEAARFPRRRTKVTASTAGDATEILRKLAAADACLGCRQDIGELEEVGHDFIDLGIVLHGSRAQRIEAVAHAEKTVGQGIIVTGEVVLGSPQEAGQALPVENLRRGSLGGGDPPNGSRFSVVW